MNIELLGWILIWTAVTLLGTALAGLYRAVAILSKEILPDAGTVGPREGTLVPPVGGIPWGTRALLLMVDRSCITCGDILNALSDGRLVSNVGNTHVLYRDAPGHTKVDSRIRVLDQQNPLFDDLEVTVTPMAIRLSSDNRVVDAMPVGSVDALEQFLRRTKEEGSTI